MFFRKNKPAPPSTGYSSYISGVGHFVPPRVVTNDDLTQYMDTNDAWIRERTGIESRHWVEEGDGNTTSTMGAAAAKIAMERAGVGPKDIDHVIFATLSPDYYFPGCGVQVQEILGLDTVGALDVRNQCSGFVYAVSGADQFIKTGMYKNILVIGSELQSGGLNLSTEGRGTAIIFGDGAGAIILSRSDNPEESAIMSSHLHSQGKHALELAVELPSSMYPLSKILEKLKQGEVPTGIHPHMNGNFVFRNAVIRFGEVIKETLKAHNLSASDLDLFIPHQANLRISQFIQKRMKLSDDQVFNNIQSKGNTTAASIPIALSEAWEQGKLKRGDKVLLAAFGSGFTWGSVIMRW